MDDFAKLAEYVGFTNALEVGAFVPTRHTDTYPFITPTGTELAGKSVIITGASKGIGRATASRLVKAGCSKIAIAARTGLDKVAEELKLEAQQLGLDPPTILPVQVDVTSDESVKAAAQTVEDAFGGKIDILINNAGYLPKLVRIGEADPSEWWKGFEVNLKGTFLCAHYFLPLLLRSDTKIVINLTSIGANLLTIGGASYQASRFTNCRITEFLARDYEEEGLIAISVHPGGVKTDMGDNLPEVMHFSLTDTADLPGDTIVWLTKERREWLNGRYVSSPWDMQELEGKKEEIVERDLFKFRMTV
ncbi:Glucose/ribitol dehydrogenase [Penicillium malachiteum]|uniref:Glucose/ribitol dehydrogenase n=1 Tax=Penicillium malachiteum TaxID=1324776 RepID=UPI002546B021|nr:Glucose/ribitol dehydrogenase [Penicillium malachiteum]KAJ5729795.1 Glucose/ribitol dehydrogenase [Penicillium malachiteum]